MVSRWLTKLITELKISSGMLKLLLEERAQTQYTESLANAKNTHTGETYRKWETREKEHKDKVRLTLEDIEKGNTEKAKERMNSGDGGLAKHASSCTMGIDWENAKIVGRESRWTQRKYLEGIETLREKNKGVVPLPLNSYNQLDQWQSTLYGFFNI